MRPGCRSRKGGFVLVTVLFITTLLLGAASSFAWFARQEMRRVAAEEFALVSRSLAVIACQTVGEWIAADNNTFDSKRELLYSGTLPLELYFGDWLVGIEIEPQDRLIPINDIFLPDGVTIRNEYEYPWQQFWEMIGDDETGTLLLDFLDKDTTARAGSREEDYYLNRKISDLSELLLLPELRPGILYRRRETDIALDRYFTVYGDTKINVNIAPRDVLAILDREMGADVAESIISYRAEHDIESAKDLIKIPAFPVAVSTRLNNILSYRSNYFVVKLKVQFAERERNFEIVLKRAGRSCQLINWRE